MRILVTSASRPFPRKLAASLGRDNDILLTDRAPASANGNYVRCALSHDRATRDLVSGVDAIVHWGQVDPESDDADALDFQTRSTYNLLRAAAEEGVSRCIYLSSLRILEDYDEHLDVNEHWKPQAHDRRAATRYPSRRMCLQGICPREEHRHHLSEAGRSGVERGSVTRVHVGPVSGRRGAGRAKRVGLGPS